MRKTLYLKFLLAYFIFGFFGFVVGYLRQQYDHGTVKTGKGGSPIPGSNPYCQYLRRRLIQQ